MPQTAFEIVTQSRKLEHFRIGHPGEKQFGRLTFVGGLELTSRNAHFGAVSGFRLTPDRSRLLAVTDTGFWLTALIERDAGGVPLGLRSVRMAPILDQDGKPFSQKWFGDAESVELSGNTALVSFERENRIARYTVDFDLFTGRPEPVPHRIPAYELRRNKGLEAVATSPTTSPLNGASIVVSERSIDKNGNIFGAVIDGPKRGVFKVERRGEFDITDAAFLPNGDLLLLERKFRMAEGVAVRIRRIDGSTINRGKLLSGSLVLEANMAFQIDNMEGLAVSQDDAGNTYVSLFSDDNHSLLQRTLFLEFKLDE
jgi:hypothetical protein